MKERAANPGQETEQREMTDKALKEGVLMETTSDSKLLLTIPEAAQRLNLGRSFVYQLVMKGEIASIKIGRARRIPVNALEQFITAQIDYQFDSNRDSNLGRYQ